MNLFKKIYCRAFQSVMYLAIPFLPYRKPTILTCVEDIVRIIKENKKNSPLVVTDGFLYSSGACDNLLNALSKNAISFAVYSGVCANPTVDNVNEGREIYLKRDCDCLIAFGGGSAMDSAKAVGALIAYPKKNISDLKGLLKVNRKLPLFFAIPTTAGTGSETTIASVITDSKLKHKYTVNSFPLIPNYAVLDERVTFSLPKSLTATTGLDALTHAVEAYIGRSTTPQTRKYAKRAVKLIFENILTAYNQPQNAVARKNMLTASFYAGIAFTKSYVGYVHAVAHSLGGRYNIPHGLANSVLLPVFLQEYGTKIHKKLFKLSLYSGLCDKSVGVKKGAEIFIAKINAICKECSIPSCFEQIKEEDIRQMAVHADREANPLYPVPVLYGVSELEKIYYKVMKKD